ncbi:hypothetical protein ACRE1S_02695 [Helicobacter himalayensis]|uniref:hypothetical protein n=1 Tax=Helicobacter himalayensis TaxID=1591088 RepID=UPI003D6EC334
MRLPCAFLLSLGALLSADLCSSNLLRSIAEKTKDEFNPPVRLDEMTLLIDVRCMQNTLTYFYMLDFNDMDMQLFTNPSTKQALQEQLNISHTKLYCNYKDIEWFRESNVPMRWRYFLKENLYIDIQKSPKDCL